MLKTGKEIVARTEMFHGMKYWYGAKRQLATIGLANKLRGWYPDVWTQSYYDEALMDIDGKTLVCDCSGLVCGCYDMKDIGSYQMEEEWPEYKDGFKAGMVAWKKGHVGLITDSVGHIAEMSGIKNDFLSYRTFDQAGFTKVLYHPDVDYDFEYDKGWHLDDNGWWYAVGTHKGEYVKSAWKVINNHWFYFDENGYIKTGLFEVDGRKYFATEEGLYHGSKDIAKGDIELWEVSE